MYVYPKERHYTYAQLLAGVVQEEEFHTWTQEEVDKVYNNTNRDVRSNCLKIYTKHSVGYKSLNNPLVQTGTLLASGTVLTSGLQVHPSLNNLPLTATRDTQQTEL